MIPAGTQLKKGGSPICEDVWSSVNSICSSIPYYFKIERLTIDRLKVEFDLICDHYPTDDNSDYKENTKKSMEEELKILKKYLMPSKEFLEFSPSLVPKFFNESIEKYEDN